MAETKTKPTNVSVTQFLGKLSDAKRRKDCNDLVKMMKEATGEPAVMWGPSIVGFGQHHYRYESGREGDICAIGFSPRKAEFALYLSGGLDNFREELGRLGKHKTGKGCLYLRTLDDVDRDTLKKIIEKSVQFVAAKHTA